MSEDEAEKQPNSGFAADWSSEQFLTLIDRIEKTASANRTHRTLTSRCTYGSRKVDWEAVKFDCFSADDCRQQWERLVLKVGKIRTVKELLDSAAAWLKKPIQMRGHTDLPKKPMSMYFAFQTKMAKKIRKKHPEMGVTEVARIVKKLYDELPESKKAQQKEVYKRERAEYEERLKEFYDAHPELKPVSRPRRPKKLFIDEQVRKKLEHMDDSEQQQDKAHVEELRKKYATKWQHLSDKKKTRWILKSVAQQHDYAALNPKAIVARLLSADEQKLLAIHQGRPLRPPSGIVQYFMSVCPNAVTTAPDGEATEEEHQQQRDPGVRSYAVRWKALPVLEQIEHWRAYYQAVTTYQSGMEEWLAKQDGATRDTVVAEEKAVADKMTILFNDEEERGKKYGYTIKGPAGLVAFEERRLDRLKAKHPEEAADPSGLRKIALAAYVKLSDEKRKTYEDKERERLDGVVVTAPVKSRKRQPSDKEGGASAAKRLKSQRTIAIDGIELPPEPKKPPRSAYTTFLVHRSECPTANGGSGDVDGLSAAEPASHKRGVQSAAQCWKLMDEKERQTWVERWKAEKLHYEARMKAYEKSLTPEQRAAYDRHRHEQANVHRLKLNEAKKAKEAVRQQYVQRSVVYHPPGTDGGSSKGGKLVQTTIDAVLKTGLARATVEAGAGGVDAGNDDTDDEQRDSVTDIEDAGSSGTEETSSAQMTNVVLTRSPMKTAASTASVVAATAASARAAANDSDDTEEDEDDDRPAAAVTKRQSPHKTSSKQPAVAVPAGRKADHAKTKADRAKTKAAASAGSGGDSISAGRQPTASQSLQGTSSAGSLGSQKSVNGHTGAAGKPRKPAAAAAGKAP